MKYLFFAGVLLSVSVLFSCDNEKTKSGDTNKDESVAGTSMETMVDSSTVNFQPGQMNSGTENNASVQTVTTPNSQVTASTAPNPAHGEPGHRCDIEVGAPLNSPPTKGAAVSNATPISPGIISSSPQGNAPPPTVQPVTNIPTAPGMNPAHGQPGHDCAIPVGSPLKK